MNKTFDAIIVTSDEPYDHMWHTQIIFTNYLLKNAKVFYIGPPKKWNPVNIIKKPNAREQVNSNLVVLEYPNKHPSSFNSKNDSYLSEIVTKELRAINAKKILIWQFDSFRSSFSDEAFLKEFDTKRIYHVIDPFYKNPLNEWLSENAKVIVLTSPRNNPFYEKWKNKVINIPQCLDIEEQSKYLVSENTIDLKFKENYFVLLGTISEDIDLTWLEELLNNEVFKLIIIGKTVGEMSEKWNQMICKTNVQYLGLLEPQKFYPIIKKAKAGLIVYNERRRNVICSPLKAMNYLLSQIPTISNTECEMNELEGSCLFKADNVEEMKRVCDEIGSGKLKFDKNVATAYLKRNTVESATERILEKLSEV